MEFLERLSNEIRGYSLRLGSTYCMYISHVNNPHSFYVRPLEYNKYMATIQARGNPVGKFDACVGAIVIFESKETQDYVRGKIILLKREDNQLMCDLFAIDVGCFEYGVPVNKIWKPYHNVNVPALAFHCQLANCVSRSERWKVCTIEAMRGYVEGKVAQITIKNILAEAFIVEVSVSAPDDLATLLAITKHSHWDNKNDVEDYHLLVYTEGDHFYSERILQVKSVLRVRMQSGAFLDKFFAAHIDEYNTYLEDSNKYTEFAMNTLALSIDQLKKDAPVGVFYHHTKKFERGVVRDIFPEKYSVMVELVDWGNLIEEPIHSLRAIPDEYMSNPPIAIYCAIHSSQYAKSSSFETGKLANISQPGIEFCIKIEEVSNVYGHPNQVTVFGVRTESP